MENDLVSIITPSYNSAEYIEDTILSIQAQTYTNWELLITDDCSTDNTVEIIERYVQKDSRIKLFKLLKNSGAGVSRNNSINEARGRYIAFCDSDDSWFPNKLEKQISFMKEKGSALVFSSYMECNDENEVKGIVVCNKKETYASMKRGNGIGCLTAIYDTEMVGKVFMPTIRKRQDWGLWLNILSKCGIAYGMKQPLASYRVRPNSISRKKVGLLKHNMIMYMNVLGFSKLKSFFFLFFVFMPIYTFKRLKLKIINR